MLAPVSSPVLNLASSQVLRMKRSMSFSPLVGAEALCFFRLRWRRFCASMP
jgi:hypothetical protein